MADPIYVVTLKSYDDLDGFYSDMKSDGFKIHMKRPISRNTQYYMTDAQAATLRNDSRVMAVERRPEDIPGLVLKPKAIRNNEMNVQAGDFQKADGSQVMSYDWGKLHCAGTDAQRRKGSFGDNGTKIVNDTLEIFNNGKHVDIVTCDDTTSFDCLDWNSPTTNTSRFIQYEWYNNLNSYVGSIDDDSQTLPTGNYPNYLDNATNTDNHGTHVTGTIAGKWYGWANEANIYALQVLNGHTGTTPVPSLLIFDYLRAFHRYKPINPETGRQNPTITNHSYGWSYDFTADTDGAGWGIEEITEIGYRGTVYNASNPNPSGWTMDGLKADFGFGYDTMEIPSYNTSIIEDAKDAIEDGVVCIGAAGNDNTLFVPKIDPNTGAQHVDWNNYVKHVYYAWNVELNQGMAPTAAPGFICVGALDNDIQFTRADFTNYGPRVDVFAPGTNIISVYNQVGILDTKYGGSNWFGRKSGTSMASPEVAGMAAILATNKRRVTSEDIRGFIQQMSKENDMTFDVWQKATDDAYYNKEHELYHPIALEANASNQWLMTWGYDRNGHRTNSGRSGLGYANMDVNIYVGDTLEFLIGFNQSGWSSAQTGHPFYIKTTNTTGTADQVTPSNSGCPAGQPTNQGTTGGSSGTEVVWTPHTAGTYYGVCANHSGMSVKINVLPVPAAVADPGGFHNVDCSKGSLNAYMQGKNPRLAVGYIGGWFRDTLKGVRNVGKPYANRQVFPRPNGLHEGAPGPLAYTLAVGNSGSGSYTMTGHDRNSAYTAKTNPTLSIKKGDTINFEMNAAGHPFWLSVLQSTGQPAAGNVPSGVANNGTANGATITWDTTNAIIGTYYYNCEYHSSMTGMIFVNA